MKQRLFTVIILVLMAGLSAQGYEFAASSGTFTALSGGTNPSFTGSVDDGYMVSPAPIGFTFRFWGVDYTTFAVSTNGWMALDTTISGSGYTNDLIYFETRPLIAPLWDDLDLQAFSNFSYKTEGSAPNRILTAEWLNQQWRYDASGNTISFQVKLYEGTNKIEYIYRQESGAVSSAGASIGLAGPVANLFISLNGTGVSPSTSWTIETTSLNTKPANGQVYAFTPTGGAMSGNYTVKSSGGSYSNFNNAFKDLNARGVSGAVTFNVDAGFSSVEDCVLISATGTAATPITFKKTGDGSNPVIRPTGGSYSLDFGIAIAGGDYITFDGIDVTINTGSSIEFGYYVYNASATNGAQNNTIKNCKVTLSRANTSSRGIYQNIASSPSSSAGANSNNKYQYITVENSYQGIYTNGSASFPDLGMEISNCTIGSSSSNDIGNGSSTTNGIRLTSVSGASVYNNEVRNVTVTGAVNVSGIFLENIQGTNNLYNNKVYNVQTTSTSTSSIVYGIRADINASHTCNAYNNVVYGVLHGIASASSTQVIRAIAVNVSGAGTANVYYNSARIDENAAPTSTVFYTGGGTINARNNIFANFSTAGATSIRSCWHHGTNTTPSTANNILYINTGGTNNNVGYGSSSDRKTLQAFAASISGSAPVDGNESGSANHDPNFTSTTDLTLTGSSPARNSGAPISGITKDITGADRDANHPNIGAYETAVTQNDKSAPVISNVTVLGTGTPSPEVSVTITDNSNSVSNAVVSLWYRLSSSSGAYTGLDADTKPAGVMNGTYTWNTSLSALTAGTYSFYIAARDGQGAGSGIWVNPIWASAFSGLFNAGDPPNYASNPDANANTRSFRKTQNLAGGTYNVGASHTLNKLTDIANELNNATLLGDVIYELNSDYDGTSGETYPITFNQFSTSGGSWSVTIRVKTGAGARTTSGSSSTQLIILNGVDNLKLDGREGGTGSAKAWTIWNTNGSGTTFTFINDATNNTIRYCTIRGVNTSSTSGTVVFSTTNGTTGNDDNTIEYCEIRDGATTPSNAVYASGTNTTETHFNSGITISNCEIYNFFAAGAVSNGLYILGGNTGWTITGNSFYQTATRAASSGNTHSGININNSSGNNFTISNNYIGGGAANCGGTAWTMSGSYANRFVGINLSIGTSTASSVQNNTIANFTWSSTSGVTGLPGVWAGIYLASGNANIGTVTGNTIGSGTGTGSIQITISTTGGVSMGIGSASSGTFAISNNSIGAINVMGNAVGVSASVNGIWTTGSATSATIHNNTIGSTSTANSINASNAATGTTAAVVQGILNSGSASAIAITSNTIANLNSAYVPSSANSSSIVRGIVSSSGTNTITGNTIRNLSTAANATGTTSSASVIGISMTSSTAGASLSQNQVYELNNSNIATSVKSVIGIHYSGASTGTNLIARNFVHSLRLSSSSASNVIGLNLAAGTSTIQNNMIRLGISSAGDITGGHALAGINESSSSVTSNYYFNSIYIGGSGVTGSTATYALNSLSTNTRIFQNNIFVNNRSNGTGSGKHYTVSVAGTGVNPSGLTMNFNLYHATGTGGVFGFYNSVDRATLTAWRTATGQDSYSAYGDPSFVAPTNTTSPDLHLTGTTPAEGSGTNISSITDDYDGNSRSGLTPVDIGADAGNFTPSDLFPPLITYTVLGNTSLSSSRTLSSVTITDQTGVPTSGILQPRIWFRRSAPSASSWVSTQGTLQSGSGTNGTWSFSIDYSLLGITPSLGEIYQYYVVAQDAASTPNLVTNPIGGVHSDVNTQSSAPSLPHGYSIVPAIYGSVNVGTGQTYTTLTASGGLFAAINAGVLTGNVTVNITSNTSENGTHALNQWPEDGDGGYTLTIQPGDASTKTLSGSSTSGLIKLNGTDRVTIDGRSGGSGNYLTFTNTNSGTSSSVIWIASASASNGATGVTVRNCTVMGHAPTTTYGGIIISSGTTIGGVAEAQNNNITITNNEVKKAVYGVAAVGPTGNQTGLVISNNTIGSATSGDKIGLQGIALLQQQDLEVANNSVFGISRSGGDNNAAGIYVAGTISGGSIKTNKIYDIKNTHTSGYAASGMLINSSTASTNLTISNNLIYDVAGYGWASNWTDNGHGIRINAGGGYNMYYNSVNMASNQTDAGNSAALYIPGTGTGLKIANNIFANVQTTGTRYSVYTSATNAIFHTIDHNDYYSLGSVGYLESARADLAAWKTATGQDANSVSADPRFAGATDLSISTGSGYNTCPGGSNGGTPIAGITTDYAGNTRNTTIPDMGAFEITVDRSLTSSSTLPVGNYDNVTVNGTGITATIGGIVVLSGDLTLTNGTVSIGSGNSLTVNGTINQTGGSFAEGSNPTTDGFSNTAVYLSIAANNHNISGFSASTSVVEDNFPLRVKRQWTINGTQTNSKTITFKWTADDDENYDWTGKVASIFRGTNEYAGDASGNSFVFDSSNRTLTVLAPISTSKDTWKAGLKGGDQTLPVELSSFTATISAWGNVQLTWVTQTETNVVGFKVLRSGLDDLSAALIVSPLIPATNTSSLQTYIFQDKEPGPEGLRYYWLNHLELDGTEAFHGPITIEYQGESGGVPEIPLITRFDSLYPNPFNPSVSIAYQLATPTDVKVNIYNARGQLVKRYAIGHKQPGRYRLQWNGLDENNARCGSGVYVFELLAGRERFLKKATLLK